MTTHHRLHAGILGIVAPFIQDRHPSGRASFAYCNSAQRDKEMTLQLEIPFNKAKAVCTTLDYASILRICHTEQL